MTLWWQDFTGISCFVLTLGMIWNMPNWDLWTSGIQRPWVTDKQADIWKKRKGKSTAATILSTEPWLPAALLVMIRYRIAFELLNKNPNGDTSTTLAWYRLPALSWHVALIRPWLSGKNVVWACARIMRRWRWPRAPFQDPVPWSRAMMQIKVAYSAGWKRVIWAYRRMNLPTTWLHHRQSSRLVWRQRHEGFHRQWKTLVIESSI